MHGHDKGAVRYKLGGSDHEIGILGEESRCRVRLDCNQGGLFKAIVDWPKRIYSNSKGESTKRDGEAPTSAGVLWNGASSVRRCTNIRGGFVQEARSHTGPLTFFHEGPISDQSPQPSGGSTEEAFQSLGIGYVGS